MHSESNPPNSSSGSPGRERYDEPEDSRRKSSKAQPSILRRWGISEADLTRLVDDNPSLRGILSGYVAERKLQSLLDDHPHISGSVKHDDHDRSKKHDRVVTYKGQAFSIEVKSLQSNSVRRDEDRWIGKAQVDGSDRRTVSFPDGSTLETTLLLRGQFDILAVNCFAFEGKWNFAFALNRDLPRSRFKQYSESQRAQLIASLVTVTWPPEPPFVADLFPLVEKLFQERMRSGRKKA